MARRFIEGRYRFKSLWTNRVKIIAITPKKRAFFSKPAIISHISV